MKRNKHKNLRSTSKYPKRTALFTQILVLCPLYASKLECVNRKNINKNIIMLWLLKRTVSMSTSNIMMSLFDLV